MPFQVTNPLRGPSIVRAVDAGSYTITLNDLRGNPTTETVSSADIRRVMWSSNGYITIIRNSVPILNLSGSGDMRLDEIGSISNNSTQSIVITIATGGSLVMEVNKTTSYNVEPGTGFTL